MIFIFAINKKHKKTIMAFNFDKIKSLFVETQYVKEEENKTSHDNTKNKNENKTQRPVSKDEKKLEPPKYNDKTDPTTPISQPKRGGNFNQKIFDSLTKAIADANLPGEDYLEFMDALNAMKSLPLEESVKIQTVMATLSPRGLTAAKVIESADYYLKVLENEREKFNQVLEKQKSNQIGNQFEQIKTLETQIKEKSELIQKLTQEIQKNQQEIQKIKDTINSATSKIKKTENDFTFTFDSVANQIKKNIEAVKNNLLNQ